CPNGVDIPHNFALLNEGVMYNALPAMRRRYVHTSEDKRASACIGCRECEDKCPQHILISEEMPRVHLALGEGQGYTCPTQR
ncbi:MAG: 4Fe-4S binding protein, partial [Chloroflexi bacterium]|nr:4Fe-4S binding protein [Chloroflexota bacterium]